MITHVKAPEGTGFVSVTPGKVYRVTDYSELGMPHGRVTFDNGVCGTILISGCGYINDKAWIVVDSDGEVV